MSIKSWTVAPKRIRIAASRGRRQPSRRLADATTAHRVASIVTRTV